MMFPGADEGTCQGCGKRILWIEAVDRMSNGAYNTVKVPLDPSPPTYELHILNDAADPITFEWRRANAKGTQEPAYVSHFSICAKANTFSKGKK